MPQHIKKARHHRAPTSEEMPPVGVVIHSPRAVISQVILPFAVATLVGVALFAGAVHIYRLVWSRPTLGKAPANVVLAPKGSAADIKQSLETVSALYVDPYDLVRAIGKGTKEYTLIDVRTTSAFERGHIKTAIHMPDVATSMSQISTYPAIIYGDAPYSQSVVRAASALASSSKDVRILSIGWNEFRFFPNLWLPEDQWNKLQIDDYIQNAEPN